MTIFGWIERNILNMQRFVIYLVEKNCCQFHISYEILFQLLDTISFANKSAEPVSVFKQGHVYKLTICQFMNLGNCSKFYNLHFIRNLVSTFRYHQFHFLRKDMFTKFKKWRMLGLRDKQTVNSWGHAGTGKKILSSLDL